MTVYGVAVLLLSLSAALALVFTALFLMRRDDGLHLRALMILNFGVTYIVSGFAHVLEMSSSTGFYAGRPGAMQGDSTGVMIASLATPLGLCGLAIGLSVRWSRDRRQVPPSEQYSMALSHRFLTLAIGTVLAGTASAAGMLVRRAVVSDAGGERIIGVDGGIARYAFLASWLPWGMTLFALALIQRRRGAAAETWNSVVLAGTIGSIAFASSWTGGRVDTILFSLPIVVVILPWLKRAGKPLLLLAVVGVVAIVRVQTIGRVGTYGFDIWSLADWQWGRFSMVAWAGNYVEVHGIVTGETLQRGLLIVPLSILHLAGVPTPSAGRSIVELSGISLLGSDQFIHIVPGMSAELYVNFSYVGIAVGYLILGLFCGFIADRYRRASTELTRVLWGYCAMLAIFQTVNAQSGALTPRIILTGAPLFVLVALERLMRRWDRRLPRTGSHPVHVRTPASLAEVRLPTRSAADTESVAVATSVEDRGDVSPAGTPSGPVPRGGPPPN